MKSVRSWLFISLALAAIFLCFIVGKWAYKNYFNEEEVYHGALIPLKPIDANAAAMPAEGQVTEKTSSKKQAVHSVSNDNDASRELTRLRAEIETLLKKQGNEKDSESSKQKISELQQLVNKLVDKNNSTENENKKLFAVLRQFSEQQTTAEQKVKPWPAVFTNKAPVEKNSTPDPNPVKNSSKIIPAKVPVEQPSAIAIVPVAHSFMAEDMQLAAMTVTDNKEIETYQAEQTDKLAGLITIKNNSQNNSGEVIIVILKPDGTVLQKSSWETGTFQSNGSKKIYSCKLRFDCRKAENKQLSFSLSAADFMKGNYTMEVYSEGLLIGKMVKKLS